MGNRKRQGSLLATAAALLLASAACVLFAGTDALANAPATSHNALAELQQVERWSPLLFN